MKSIILSFAALLFCYKVFSQDAVYSDNKITYEDYTITPGDTIHLGFGSGMNKKFLFINYRPNILTYKMGDMPEGLAAAFSNSYIVLVSVKRKKLMGKVYYDNTFKIGDTNLKVAADVRNGFLSGEMKRVGRKI